MAKYKEDRSAWVPMTPDYQITPETVKNLRMKPGTSNIDIYVAGPEDKPDLPIGLSPMNPKQYIKNSEYE